MIDEMVQVFEDKAGECAGIDVRSGLLAVLAMDWGALLQRAVDRAEYAGHERGWRERGERDVSAHKPHHGVAGDVQGGEWVNDATGVPGSYSPGRESAPQDIDAYYGRMTDPMRVHEVPRMADFVVPDELAVHVPHRHASGRTCSLVECHNLDDRPCLYCGSAPCRVRLVPRMAMEGPEVTPVHDGYQICGHDQTVIWSGANWVHPMDMGVCDRAPAKP